MASQEYEFSNSLIRTINCKEELQMIRSMHTKDKGKTFEPKKFEFNLNLIDIKSKITKIGEIKNYNISQFAG